MKDVDQIALEIARKFIPVEVDAPGQHNEGQQRAALQVAIIEAITQVGENQAWRDELVREAHARGLMEGLDSPRPQKVGEVQDTRAQFEAFNQWALKECPAWEHDHRDAGWEAWQAALASRPPGAHVPQGSEFTVSRTMEEAESASDGMLPAALVSVADEWYRLCERRFSVERIAISGKLAEAIVEAMGAAPQQVGEVKRGALRDRTPADFAIENAGYLATAAQRLLDARNKLDALVARRDEEDDVEDGDMHAAQECVGEASDGVRSAIYEFEKRRDRALAARQPGAQEKVWCGACWPHGVDHSQGCVRNAAPPAQGIDLGRLRRAMELMQGVSRTLVDWAYDDQREAINIVKALIGQRDAAPGVGS